MNSESVASLLVEAGSLMLIGMVFVFQIFYLIACIANKLLVFCTNRLKWQRVNNFFIKKV